MYILFYLESFAFKSKTTEVKKNKSCFGNKYCPMRP